MFLPYDGVVCSLLGANFVPLGDEILLERGHQTGVPPEEIVFTVINLSSVRTVADRHKLAVYHNKHC